MTNLKNERKHSRKMSKLTFKDAAVAVVRLGIKNSTQFEQLRNEQKIPVEIPVRPDMYYKDEWESWKSFIKVGESLATDKSYRGSRVSYEELKTMNRRLGITTKEEYYKAILDGRLPEHTPADPQAEYPKEFEGWSLFVAQEFKYLSFSAAKAYIKRFKLKNSLDWRNFCREGFRPDYIPSLPDRVYEEFTDWPDFLGYTEE